MAQDRFNEPPPEKLPVEPWKVDDETIRSTNTCTFGKINFENVEHAGGKKPAKVTSSVLSYNTRQIGQLQTGHLGWQI